MSARRNSTVPLPTAVSLLLDLARFGFATTVAVGHLTEINPFLPNLMRISHAAGPLFFVLSGFLIRFVTKIREHTMRDFMLDRMSRVYSVVLPAVVWTLLCDAVARHLDRDTYLQLAGNYLHWASIRVLLNVTFLSAAWSLDTHMLSNAPFWTLSYEVPYYFLFGFLLFVRGWKRVAWMVAAAVVMGPQVLSLAPLWLLGVMLYDVYQRVRFQERLRWITVGICVLVLAVTIPFWPWLAHQHNPLLHLLHLPEVRAKMWRYAVVLPFTILLLALMLLVDRIPLQSRSRGLRFVRRVANGTFVVYLFHYPMLLVGRTMGLSGTVVTSVLYFVVTIALLTACAPVTDRFREVLRGQMQWMLQRISHGFANKGSEEKAAQSMLGSSVLLKTE